MPRSCVFFFFFFFFFWGGVAIEQVNPSLNAVIHERFDARTMKLPIRPMVRSAACRSS